MKERRVALHFASQFLLKKGSHKLGGVSSTTPFMNLIPIKKDLLYTGLKKLTKIYEIGPKRAKKLFLSKFKLQQIFRKREF